MQPRDVWYPKTPLHWLLRSLLVPLSWLYSGGWSVYRGLYQFSIKKSSHPHSPIVCVANLVVGGLGKSPLTLAIAKEIQSLDRLVVVGCNGYGSPRAKAASVAPDGPLDPVEWGDEPAMIRWLHPDLPLIVGRRRVLAAELAAKHFPDHVLLMDDGMQHLPLRKDLTIVLDESEPKNKYCLPAGPYREPRRNLVQADLVLPGRFQVTYTQPKFVDWQGERVSLQSAHVLCAIGVPEQFERSIRDVGVEVLSTTFLGDHDPLTAGTLWEEFKGTDPIVVTAKDFVKIRSRADLPKDRLVISLREARVEPEFEFRAWLKGKLDGIKP